VVNKSDLPQKIDLSKIRSSFRSVCVVSALDRTGFEKLDSIVREMFEGDRPETAGEIITSARQAEAISRAHASIAAALSALKEGFTPDAVLSEAESGVAALGELLGKTVRSDVTDRIFSRFCVGK
jgi:tRNA modification GTPase